MAPLPALSTQRSVVASPKPRVVNIDGEPEGKAKEPMLEHSVDVSQAKDFKTKFN